MDFTQSQSLLVSMALAEFARKVHSAQAELEQRMRVVHEEMGLEVPLEMLRPHLENGKPVRFEVCDGKQVRTLVEGGMGNASGSPQGHGDPHGDEDGDGDVGQPAGG